MIHEADGHTRLCGLIGHPVGHTFSPLIHNTLAEETGTNLVYVPFDVESEGALRDAVFGAYGLNVLGMNVTVPYKQAVMDSLREVDETAAAIGAVNTLVRVEGGYKGYNTDYIGLYRALLRGGVQFPRNIKGQPAPDQGEAAQAENLAGTEDKVDTEQVENLAGAEGNADSEQVENLTGADGIVDADQMQAGGTLNVTDTVVIVGAGGAARAAGFVAGKCGVENLVILNRTIAKGRDLAEDIQKHFPEMKVSVMPLEAAGQIPFERYLAIQCTKVGLAPDVDASPIEDPAFYQKLSYAYDCIYNPEKTRFLQLAEDAGIKGDCGLYMLLYQGVAAYELWTGETVQEAQLDKVLEKFRQALK